MHTMSTTETVAAADAESPLAASPPWSAVVFDMDGVVTDTASLHAVSWQQLFDDVLADERLEGDIDRSPFDVIADYRKHVDGRQREDGVRVFLNARGVTLPEGDESDDPAALTVAALAKRKNDYFNSILRTEGVRVFEGTLRLIRRLRGGGIPIALVTASRNAPLLLENAHITELFDVIVDGQVARDLGLPGKPDPATFLEASHRLGVDAEDAAVLEDAVSGVQAAKAGGFGLVVGVARDGNRAELEAAGADVVVNDATELDLGDIRDDPWELSFEGIEPEHEGRREALTTLANGYISVRGAAPETTADGIHYPGTYMAGIFNRLVSRVNERDLEHESMVNLPRWAICDIRLADGEWWSEGGLRIVEENRTLSFASAVLTRTAVLVDSENRRLRIKQQRLVSMDKHHVAAMLTEITPVNYSGTIFVRTGVDTSVLNDNVPDYDQLAKRHIVNRYNTVAADGTLICEVETTQSHLRVAMAQSTTLTQEPTHAVTTQVPEVSHAYSVTTVEETQAIYREFAVPVESGYAVSVDTTTAFVNSRDSAITSVRGGAVHQLDWLPDVGFYNLLRGHTAAIKRLWDRFDIEVDSDAHTQLIVHLHTFHLLQSLSPHTALLDVGTPARGLHGEAYRGHIFWDELFILPLLNLRLPEISKALLLYRWRRLDAARHNARRAGLKGALFPWQSGSDGREETPIELYNPRSQRWMPDNSRLQYHVGLAIAYNTWQHYRATADTGWLAGQGGELFIEIVRLFASMATYDATEDRFHIHHVMGPDEFHDGYPGTPGSGVSDNAYTNVMTAWMCRHAVEIFRVLSSHEAEDLIFRLDIQPAEITHWGRLAARLAVPFNSDGIISQFAGYDDLKELDWEAYRRKYGNIGRMDLIMESEDDSTNCYKLSKQADVNMLFFILGPEGVIKELRRMGYEFTHDQVERTIDYYVARSTNGSSLSNVVNAGVLATIGRGRESWQAWQEAAVVDINDTQWGTTREGVHLGAMAGTLDVVVRAFAGVLIRFDRIEFRPHLPKQLGSVSFRVLFQGQIIDVRVYHDEIILMSRSHETSRIKVQVFDEQRFLDGGATLHFTLDS
ncbi:beta-phosphoglucomutase family hydrolase [Brevibacterium daeguense]|uniref:Beta-phosphoglucomutase family hydrolase n=2 Tax=Brevibacterium daeguense TaxID=909936 RepID=A0ABP8EIU5_9MICO